MGKCEMCMIEGWFEADSKIFSKQHNKLLRVCNKCFEEIRNMNLKMSWEDVLSGKRSE